MKFLALAAAVALIVCGAPAHSAELTKEQAAEAQAFAINNDIFVLQHEIGHLFIGEFKLPVLGKEEDAADSLASVSLLERETDEADQVLVDSAAGWDLSDFSRGDADLEAADFYDEHSLDLQRAYQVVCFMVGADPAAFGDVADDYEMDKDRQESCADDYKEAADSWDGLLKPFLKAMDGKGGTIKIVYVKDTGAYAEQAKWLNDSKLLENAARWVETTYALPRDLTFTAKLCDEENAYYAQEDAGITFCYEMTNLFFALERTDLLAPPDEK